MGSRLWFWLLLLCLPAYGQAPTRVVSTIANLADLYPGLTQPHVLVQGFYNSGDWGAPKAFRWDSTNALSTNAIRRATKNGVGRWVHDWDGDALVFGADKSGAADSAAAINAAIDNAFSNRLDKVHLPPGIYSVSTTVVVRPNVLLYGDFASYTEAPSMVVGNTNYKSGATAWLKLADGANCPVVSVTTNGATYLRQSAAFYDGGTRNAYFVNSGLRNIGIFGNRNGQTKYNCHGIVAHDAWNILIDSVTINDTFGRGILLRNCNAVRISNNNVTGPWFGGGVLFDDCADMTVMNNYIFGSDGPAVWLNGIAAWKSQFLGNLIGNSYTETLKGVSISGTNITTADVHRYETGDMVMFENQGGTLPSQIQSNQTCMVIKIDSTSFSIATNWSDAEAGIAMTLSGGSGTNYVYKGKPAGVFLSHGANRNSFTGNRVDQTYAENFIIQGGAFNSIVGNELSEAGTFGSPAVNTKNVAAIRLESASHDNVILGNVGAWSDYGLTMSPDSYQNVWALNAMYSPSAEFTNAASVLAANTVLSARGSWYFPSSSVIGDYDLQTAARFRGGTNGTSIITLDRQGSSKVGLNISGDTFRILDETNQTVMVSFVDNSTTAAMYLGGQGDPRTTTIYGVDPTGTDKAGLPMRFIVGGTGAGSAASANVEVWTPIVGASGTSDQTVRRAFSVNGAPTGKRTSLSVWDNEAGSLGPVTTTNLVSPIVGRTTLFAGSVTVTNLLFSSNSIVMLTYKSNPTLGGVAGILSGAFNGVASNGVLTITSTSGTDTNQVFWFVSPRTGGANEAVLHSGKYLVFE